MRIKRRDLTAFYISYQDATIKLMTNIAKNFNINVEEFTKILICALKEID